MRCPRQTRRQDLAHEQGFTLIEALIAMVILVGGLTALAALFAQSLTALQFTRDDLVAKQKATQALEGVYSARNDASVGFASIQNKSAGGIFNDGFQPLFLPGANGIVGTTSDTTTLDSETSPGPDGIMGTADDVTMPLVNLQRQILHGTEDVGRKKLNSARDRIKAINPNVQVDLHDMMFRSENAMPVVQDYDIVIDGTDNFPTRYLSNDVCVLTKKPNIYGSIFRFDGQCTVFAPHLGGPCYRCMFPEPPPPGMVPSCAEGGVLGVLPGIIGVGSLVVGIVLLATARRKDEPEPKHAVK